MSSAFISLRGVTKVYILGETRVNALAGIDLDIEAGEFVGITGPSGSGKSTLMNIIGCLDRPTSGSYYFEGRDVSRLSDDELAQIRNEKIGFVFQHFNLLPRATVFENVMLPLVYSRKVPDERHVLNLLESLGLGERVQHYPNQLSGGQQQRVAIARALVNDPALILADEPTGALDTKTGAEIMTILEGLNREGRTIVVVSHERQVVSRCRRVISVRDGLIERDEPVETPGRTGTAPLPGGA